MKLVNKCATFRWTKAIIIRHTGVDYEVKHQQTEVRKTKRVIHLQAKSTKLWLNWYAWRASLVTICATGTLPTIQAWYTNLHPLRLVSGSGWSGCWILGAWWCWGSNDWLWEVNFTFQPFHPYWRDGMGDPGKTMIQCLDAQCLFEPSFEDVLLFHDDPGLAPINVVMF